MKNPFKKEVSEKEQKPKETENKEDTPAIAQKKENPIVELFTGLIEKTESASPYVTASQMRPYNPDDIFQKQHGYGIYEEMLQDDQVSVCMRLKKDLVLASGWEFVIDENTPEMVEVKEFLETCLTEETEGAFDDMIEEVLSAFDFGFSISEKVFRLTSERKLALKYLRTRHPGTWLLHTDEHGVITKFEQLAQSGNLTIDPRSIIHYINQPKFQNPYGTSDLRAAYNAWFIKRQVTKYFAIFLEKSSSPVPVAKYKKNTPKSAVSDIFDAIKSFQSKTALAYPDDIDVMFLAAKSSGEVYKNAISLFNMWIGRALFIPDLLGFQGGETGGGSYSLGKDQIKIFLKHIGRRRATIERLVNLNIIRPLVMFNYGDLKKFPKWRLKPVETEDATEFAKIWLTALNGPKYKPTHEEVNHFRSLIKFPESDEAEAEVILPPLPGAPLPNATLPGAPEKPQGGNPEEAKPIVEDEATENLKAEGVELPKPKEPPVDEPTAKEGNETPKEGKTPEVVEPTVKEQPAVEKPEGEPIETKEAPDETEAPKEETKPAEDETEEEEKRKKKALSSEEKPRVKVDEKAIERKLEGAEKNVLKQLAPITEKAINEIESLVSRLGVIGVVEAGSWRLSPLDELQAAFRLEFINLFNEAQGIAKEELNGAESKAYVNASPLIDAEFLRVVEAEVAAYTDDLATTLLKKARVFGLEALKNGYPIDFIVSKMREVVTEEVEVSVARFARTKFTETMNRGRRSYFEQSGVIAAYQYSAILDDRTTDICQGLHGKIFKAGTEPTPPLHFNCRSLLIPITKYEDFKIDERVGEEAIEEFIKENKGEGF